MNKYEQIHWNHEIFEKSCIINANKFISFQRKTVYKLNYARWDNKFVCQAYFINNILQYVIYYGNNKNDRQKPNIQQ